MAHRGTAQGTDAAGALSALGPAANGGAKGTAGGAKGTAGSLRRALLITAAAALIPGLAHIRAGRTRIGAAMITGFGLPAAGAAIVVVRRRESLLLEIAVRPGWLTACAAAAALTAITWAALISRSYLLVRPRT